MTLYSTCWRAKCQSFSKCLDLSWKIGLLISFIPTRIWSGINRSNVHVENNYFMDRHISWATIQHLGFVKNIETKVCLMQKKVVMCSLKLNTKIMLNGTEFHNGKRNLHSKNDGLKQSMIVANDE